LKSVKNFYPAKDHAMKRLGLLFAATYLIGACSLLGSNPSKPTPKFLTFAGQNVEIIPGSYMVLFDNARVSETAVRPLAELLTRGTSGRITHVFTQAVRGFAVDNLDDTWANVVSQSADVSQVRKDIRVYGSELRGNPWGPPPWGLDRIDQRTGFNQKRDYRFKIGRVQSANAVPIYVLDNGIFAGHDEFATGSASRVANVADVITPNTPFARCGLPALDASHATSIAAIAAGNKWGVSRSPILNVKVLDRGPFGNTCVAGSATSVAAGLDATLAHIRSNGFPRAIVNLSLGWPFDIPDVRSLIVSLQSAGAVVVAAAGNENQPVASNAVPASVPKVVSVGATTIDDKRWIVSTTLGSNFGSRVRIWAPGLNIKSANWTHSSDRATFDLFTGTSMAAPHVSGALALLWQQRPNLSPDDLVATLLARTTRNMLLDLGTGSTNALLYVGDATPALGTTRPLAATGKLNAVRISADRTTLYVAGNDQFSQGPFAFASIATASFAAAQLQLGNPTPPVTHCLSVADSGTIAYYGCEKTANGTREAVVVATEMANASQIRWQTPLGPDTTIATLKYGYVFVAQSQLKERVFVLVNKQRTPPLVGSEVEVVALDTETGAILERLPLNVPGFQEDFHRGVGLVVIETATSQKSELVVATLSDPPGADKTFLWRIDPDQGTGTLRIGASAELPASQLALNGHFATSLASQWREDNGNGIVIPAEVFLATSASVRDGTRTTPWAYIYKLRPDRISATEIDVIKDATVTNLSAEDSDLFFCGATSRTFPIDNIAGIPKPVGSANFDAFLGKSEGGIATRHWMLTMPAPSTGNRLGYCTYDAGNAYVGIDGGEPTIVEIPVY
jgi:subtilisin family serine protease